MRAKTKRKRLEGCKKTERRINGENSKWKFRFAIWDNCFFLIYWNSIDSCVILLDNYCSIKLDFNESWWLMTHEFTFEGINQKKITVKSIGEHFKVYLPLKWSFLPSFDVIWIHFNILHYQTINIWTKQFLLRNKLPFINQYLLT